MAQQTQLQEVFAKMMEYDKLIAKQQKALTLMGQQLYDLQQKPSATPEISSPSTNESITRLSAEIQSIKQISSDFISQYKSDSFKAQM